MGTAARQVGGGAIFLRARIGAGAVFHIRLPRHGVVADGQLHRLQSLDLVAQARGGFEVQIGGGLAHALFQIAERGLHVVAGLGRIGEARVHGDAILLVDRAQNVLDAAPDGGGGDVVFEVILLLLLPATARLVHGPLHGAGDAIRIEDHLAIDVSRSAADGLDQRGLAAQEAFLVGVENGDKRAFGNVEALAQQVDAHQHIEGAEAQIPDDLDALDGVDVRMHVAHAHAVLMQIFGEILGHALGQHGDEGAEPLQRHLADFAQHIVHLRAGGADLHGRVDEARGADDLLHEDAARALHLPFAGGGGDMYGLRPHGLPFLEAQGAIVEAGGQAEAIFGQRRLAPEIAFVHGADLRHGHMGLVREDQRIVGQIFEQGRRRLAGLAAREIARIVLDARAGACRFQHLDVEDGALLQPLGFQQTA